MYHFRTSKSPKMDTGMDKENAKSLSSFFSEHMSNLGMQDKVAF